MYKDLSTEYWGHPIKAISLNEAVSNNYPGVQNLNLSQKVEEKEPYIYHFPDGNASIARLLVRKMIPNIASGNTMEDIGTAKFDYKQLDVPNNLIKIRLNSTVLHIENNEQGVALAYLSKDEKTLKRVQAKKVIYAGHAILAKFIIVDMPDAQKKQWQAV